jgi:nucleoside-diphosphate-sugar epimerase
MKALIGYTGFVGSTLMNQTEFDSLYRSTNIHEIQSDSNEFDIVVCAAAPAKKWLANKKPDEDKSNIEKLIKNLDYLKVKKFVLISTVDVFSNPVDVNELSTVSLDGLHPYGLNRRELEIFVQERFSDHHIVRLPGLVGPGLKKNVIYDFKNNNNLELIESRSSFQFYPMNNLWSDIKKVIRHNLKLVHLTAESIEVSELAKLSFGLDFKNEIGAPVKYDFKTIYGELFGRAGNYQYLKDDSILAAKDFANN